MTVSSGHDSLSPASSAVPAAIDVEEVTDPMHALPIAAQPDEPDEPARLPPPPAGPRRRHSSYGATEAFWRRGLPLALVWIAFWLGLLHKQQLARALGL